MSLAERTAPPPEALNVRPLLSRGGDGGSNRYGLAVRDGRGRERLDWEPGWAWLLSRTEAGADEPRQCGGERRTPSAFGHGGLSPGSNGRAERRRRRPRELLPPKLRRGRGPGTGSPFFRPSPRTLHFWKTWLSLSLSLYTRTLRPFFF